MDITRRMRASILWTATFAATVTGVWAAEGPGRGTRPTGASSARETEIRVPAEAAGYSLVTVVYCNVAGKSLRADVLTPTGKPKPPSGWPVVQLLHGGAWTSGSKEEMLNQYPDEVNQFINDGFRLVVPDYRLGPANQWPAMIEDAKCAVRYARANQSNDADQVYCLGASAGGHLCSLLAVTDDNYHNDSGSYLGLSGKVQAGVSYFAPSNLWDETKGKPAQYLINLYPPGQPNPVLQTFGNADPDLLLDASVIRLVTSDSAPLRLAHGNLDMTVPPSESTNLRNFLVAAGVPNQLSIVPGARHQFRPYAPGSPTRRQTAAASLGWIQIHIDEASH